MAPTNFANMRDKKDKGLEEKLITAAESGNAAMVKRLIKKGAYVHFVENPELGYNALHYAAFNGYMDVVEGLVLAGAEVNRATTDNYTALMLASMGGFTELVEHLLMIAQPDLSVRTQEPGQDTDGSTCLHLAVLSGQDRLVRLLLVQGAEREATNKLGYTALHLAAEMGYADILATLLDVAPSLHASSALRVTAQGRTALQLAVTSGVQECVAALLADDAAEVNVLDNDGYSALHLALSHRHRRIAELLLRQGVAVNTQAVDGSTPLLAAVYSRDVKLVELLLQYSADLAVADADGTTALMAAALLEDEKAVRALLLSLRAGPERVRRALCNQQDQSGATAVHHAVSAAHEGIVKRLVDAGAAASVPNQAEKTALDLSRDMGSRRITALLLRALPPVSAEEGANGSPLVDADADMDRSALFSEAESLIIDLDGDAIIQAPVTVPMVPSADSVSNEAQAATQEGADDLMDTAERLLTSGTLSTASSGDARTPSPCTEALREGSGEDKARVNNVVKTAGVSSAQGRDRVASSASDASDASWDVVSDNDAHSSHSDGKSSPGASALSAAAEGVAPDFPAGIDAPCEFNVGSSSPPRAPLGAAGSARKHGRRQHAHRHGSPLVQHSDHATRTAKKAQRKAARQQLRRERRQQAEGCGCVDDSFGSDFFGDLPHDESCGADALYSDPTGCGPLDARYADLKGCAGREAQLQQMQATYDANLAAVSADYQARIAALQEQLRQVQGLSEGGDHHPELHSSFEWDQEIEFLVAPPGTRGEDRYAGMRSPRSPRSPRTTRRSPRGTPDGHSPRSVGGRSPHSPRPSEQAFGGDQPTEEIRRSPAGATPGSGRRGRSHYRGGTKDLLRPAETAEEEARDERPSVPKALSESRLTEMDRRFLEVLSAVLLLVAVALLVFIRLRLMGR